MAYGPENVLFYSRRPNNELGEVKEWSQQTDRVIALAPLGVSQAVSGINFVPGGFPHAGELKLVTKENSDWYEAILSPEADGTYSIATITQKTTISPHPGSFVYVPPASPHFLDYQALLVAEDNNAAISAYSLDSESNPIPASRTPFLTGLPDITGLAIDPWTGDLIVATRGGTAIAVRGFGTMPAGTFDHWAGDDRRRATTIPFPMRGSKPEARRSSPIRGAFTGSAGCRRATTL